MSDREDGRRARIRLTTRGAAIERRAFADYSDAAERLMAPLSDDEIGQINSALEFLSAIFEESAAAPPPVEGAGRLAEVRAQRGGGGAEPDHAAGREAK